MRDSGMVIGEIGNARACVVRFSHACVQRFKSASLVS